MLLLVSLAALWVGVSSNAVFNSYTVGWHSPDVVYKIGDLSGAYNKVTEKHIKEALNWFTENTCVNFIDSRDAAAAGKEIDFPIEDGACEYTKQGVLEIGGCSSRVNIVHEAMHFLGFFHTQFRPDWQQYMTPLPGSDANFTTENSFYAVPTVKYDYGSAMHYAIRNVTLPDEQFMPTMGQGIRVAFSDAQSVNWLFNCSGNCATQPKCLNGGYTHPRDCNKCMCNKYFTGNFCETPKNLVKLTCENRVHIREKETDDNDDLDQQRILHDDFFYRGEDMWDLIEVPEGKQLQVEIVSYSNNGLPLPAVNCAYSAVEINDGDLNLVGKMFCDHWRLGDVYHNFTAKSNRLGLHMEYATERGTHLFAKISLLGCE